MAESSPDPTGPEPTNSVHVEKASSDEPYRCLIRDRHEVFVDERDRSPPVGTGTDRYPTPVDYLVTSLVACQVAVLTQCLAKARVETFDIEADASVDERSVVEIAEAMPETNGVRIDTVDVSITLTVPERYEARAERCLAVYDEGCIVGRSLELGIGYTPETALEIVAD